MFNAAEAEIYGGEIEIQAVPTDRLELNLALSVTESEYKNFPDADISAPNPAGGNYVCKTGQQTPSSSCPESVRPSLAAQSVKGNSVARAPDFTAALAGRYAIPVASGEIGIGGSIMYNGGFYWEPDNRAEQEEYTLVNLQLDWRSANERYRVFVFGKNLADEEYSQYLSGGSFGDIVSAAPPRTAGIGFELQL